MKIHSTFLYLSISVTTLSPALGHAQVTLPVWLQPTWIKAKLTDFPVRNSDRYDVAQVNVVTNNGNVNPQAKPPQVKQTASLAPVETATPKLNEKHLTPQELSELRRQLRQQR